MVARKLDASEVGLPRFEVRREGPPEAREGDVFLLSSHTRAREALDFSLSPPAPGFNVFVVGADRSGRMTATVDFLKRALTGRAVPDDWVYLYNFEEPHRPLPVPLPSGEGKRFQTRMERLIPELREALGEAFGRAEYEKQVEAESDAAQGRIAEQVEALQAEARAVGLGFQQNPQGYSIFPIGSDGQPLTREAVDALGAEEQERREKAVLAINEKLRDIRRFAARQQMKLAESLRGMNRKIAEHALGGLMEDLAEDFSDHETIVEWLQAMRSDMLENIARLRPAQHQEFLPGDQAPERRYAVNLLVDHSEDKHPDVVLEANPSFESLFGYMEFRQTQGVLETDLTMIRPGSLHEANGGVLVLRAEGLATTPGLWAAIKACLRDREITVGHPLRDGIIPIAGVPHPKAIPLDIKIVLVGSPDWYYGVFSVDPEFQTYFRIKADIDIDMEASPENLRHYAELIRKMAADFGLRDCEPDAVSRLLGLASRWAGDRRRLSSQFEMIQDTIHEAAQLLAPESKGPVTLEAVEQAIRARRTRNSRIEDRMHQYLTEGTVMVDVDGKVRGQVNALAVHDLGDHAFGMPSRITARASVGRRGVINVERDVYMGGPLQQKGAMVVQGFLAGHFARRFPLSFNCSITFEQMYAGVEGDSASLAELIAILSELSDLPVRQDLAVTGSVDQRGEAQAIGGVHHKIEGFFRTCIDRGALTGTQGVIIPRANEPHLVLRNAVSAEIAAGRFHIWSVTSIAEAIELFLETPAGEPDAEGHYPEGTVYGRVSEALLRFDKIMRSSDKDSGKPA